MTEEDALQAQSGRHRNPDPTLRDEIPALFEERARRESIEYHDPIRLRKDGCRKMFLSPDPRSIMPSGAVYARIYNCARYHRPQTGREDLRKAPDETVGDLCEHDQWQVLHRQCPQGVESILTTTRAVSPVVKPGRVQRDVADCCR